MDSIPDSALVGRRRVRLRPLFVVLAIGAGLLVFCRLFPWADNAHRQLSTTAAALLTVGLVCGWWLWFTGMSAARRRMLIGLALLAIVLFFAMFRAQYAGDMQLSKFVPRPWVKGLVHRFVPGPPAVHHTGRLASQPLVLESSPDDFSQFLGPNRDGILHVREGRLARDWSQHPPREIWRKKIGLGFSGFATVGRYAFTQEETADLEFEQVVCYDLTDGDVEWVHEDPGGFTSSLGGDGPRATPTYYQGKLLTYGAFGLLNCLEAATGKCLWSHQCLSEYKGDIPDWGTTSSPLVISTKSHGDLVVQGVGGHDGHALMAFKLADGSVVWRTGDDPSGYSSPVLRTLGGVPQIVTVRWQAVTGNDPETGRELWAYDAWSAGTPKVPQPIVLDDRRVLISAGYGYGCFMLEVTRGDDGNWKVSETPLWKSMRLKPKFTNLVVRDGYAYGIDDGEFLVCLDLANGKLKWRSGRDAFFGHGQVLLVDDLLLAQTEQGEIVLIAADPGKYQELSRFTVLTAEKTWNPPTLIGNRVLVRNDQEAALFELPLE